jgi:hypothetical protein
MKIEPRKPSEAITGIIFKLEQKAIVISIEVNGKWHEFARMHESSDSISAESVSATAAMLASVQKL